MSGIEKLIITCILTWLCNTWVGWAGGWPGRVVSSGHHRVALKVETPYSVDNFQPYLFTKHHVRVDNFQPVIIYTFVAQKQKGCDWDLGFRV
jgi:hypothetical protein